MFSIDLEMGSEQLLHGFVGFWSFLTLIVEGGVLSVLSTVRHISRNLCSKTISVVAVTAERTSTGRCCVSKHTRSSLLRAGGLWVIPYDQAQMFPLPVFDRFQQIAPSVAMGTQQGCAMFATSAPTKQLVS